jgi:hypothetical protein
LKARHDSDNETVDRCLESRRKKITERRLLDAILEIQIAEVDRSQMRGQ